MKFLPAIFSFLVIALLPDNAVAQGIFNGVCEGTECSACHIALLGNTLISWLIGFITILFAVLIVVAGFGLVVSNGNPSALTAAKSRFTNAIIGLLIVLSAWLIVDTLMRGLIGGNGQITGYGPWTEIQCMTQLDSSVVAGSALAEQSETDGFPELNALQGVGTFTAYTFNPVEACRTRVSQSYDNEAACSVGLGSYLAATPQAYLMFSCDGEASGAPEPNWIQERECGLPVSQPGQICYPSGACFDTLTLSEVRSQSSDYNYPMAGPSVFIDTQNPGEGVTASTRVSNNYTLNNFNVSGTCGQGGRFIYIDPRAVLGLERVASALGTRPGINSGYRSPGCNRRVGGATYSRHMSGAAFDIAPPGGTENRCDVVRACRTAGAGFIMTYGRSTHVHCDWGSSRGESHSESGLSC